MNSGIRENRRQVLEGGSSGNGAHRKTVDRIDIEKCRKLLGGCLNPAASLDDIAGLQVESANLGRRNIDVILRGQEVLAPDESEAVGHYFQDAAGLDSGIQIRKLCLFRLRQDLRLRGRSRSCGISLGLRTLLRARRTLRIGPFTRGAHPLRAALDNASSRHSSPFFSSAILLRRSLPIGRLLRSRQRFLSFRQNLFRSRQRLLSFRQNLFRSRQRLLCLRRSLFCFRHGLPCQFAELVYQLGFAVAADGL